MKDVTKGGFGNMGQMKHMYDIHIDSNYKNYKLILFCNNLSFGMHVFKSNPRDRVDKQINV